MKSLYPVFGAGVLAFLAYALFFGHSFAEIDEVKQVPKTVRDNPGVYRRHYESYHIHSFRGK